MTYEYAVRFLDTQSRNLRQIRNIKFFHNGYEYRADYRGGFSAYIAIDRRKIGTRNFKYFGGVGASSCFTATKAMELVYEEVKRGEGK